MRDQTINDFLDDLGAKQPTPGGGVVSALNGALAAAQLKMICEYTKGSEIKAKAGFLDQALKKFVELAEADAEAYARVSEAYKSKDSGRITSSLIGAINPSMEIIAGCEELLHFCEEDYRKLNEKLKADLITALANLKASIRSSMAMINTNIEALSSHAPHNTSEDISAGREMLARVDKLYKKLGA